MINTFFVEKLDSIRAEFPLLEPTLQPYSFTDIDSIMPNCDTIFDHFEQLTRDDLMKIISVMNETTCRVCYLARARAMARVVLAQIEFTWLAQISTYVTLIIFHDKTSDTASDNRNYRYTIASDHQNYRYTIASDHQNY